MYLIFIILVHSALIGLVMETYKKIIRKDKAKIWEIRLIALLLSSILGAVVFKIVPINIIFKEALNTPFLIIPYSILIYILQLPASMKFWKPIIKDLIQRKLK